MVVRGHMRVWVYEKGQMVSYRARDNLIMTVAKDQMADLVRGRLLSSPLRAFAVGSNGTAAASNQTQLLAEVTRKAIPPADVNTEQQKNIRSGTEVTIRQVFGPGLNFTLRELGFFGDIVELPNPTESPIITPSASGGTLATGVYEVAYTWANGNGETQAGPSAFATVTGPTGSIAVVVPSLPAFATTTRIFAAPSGSPLLSGTTTTTAYTITAFPSGAAPPLVNTTTLPGIPNSGRMINRVVLGDQTILPSTVFMAEGILVFS